MFDMFLWASVTIYAMHRAIIEDMLNPWGL